MIDLDFSKIRNHDGSQDNGFEELVCQLAHLSPPKDADYFVRKEGAGGDAGVECYWKLTDGSEHAWQAKYFLNTIDTNQWSQITKSIETALKKHPDLTKYYVCLPRDWTDSRKIGSGGKQINSAWDKWLTHVKKWEALAHDCGMNVEFIYWCKHEIVQMLQRDHADFSGRARYWFNSPILTSEIFQRLAEKSRQALGDRYTPEYHIDLPIAKVFNALGNTEIWWKNIEEHVDTWIENSSKIEKAILKGSKKLDGDIGIREVIDNISLNLTSGINEQTFESNLGLYESSLNELSEKISKFVNALLHVEDGESVFDEIRQDFYKFESTTRDLLRFVRGDSCKASKIKNVLLVGEAGIGKSHLLCDVSLSRISNNLPTVFTLGQHYSGGNPLNTLKDALDLNNVSHEEFLGALDAAGEANNTNTLIIIDAINEGNCRDDWPNHLVSLLSELDRFQHISIVLSCRTTYIDWLIPDGLVEKSLVKVTHYGFKGYEHRAASQYLSQQGILKPSAPITSPEFTNPLFLKTCCKAMKEQGMTAFPKGLHGISSLLDFYINSVERTVSIRKRYRTGEDVVRKSIETFALALYPDHQFGLPMDKAISMINGFDTRANQADPLLDILIDEGVLSEDMEIDEKTGRRTNPVVRFTYERFSDYLIANSLVDSIKKENISDSFQEGGKYSLITNEDSYYKYTGILAALNIIIAEKYHIELVDIVPEKIANDEWFFEQVFIDTLQWRTAASFGDRTLKLLNTIPNQGFHSTSMDVLLKLSCEPKHPWNADFLHRNLIKRKMPERDAFWSTHITISDFEEDDDEQESILRSIIEWAQFGELGNVEQEQIRLCAIVLIWTTSSSNRKVRDQATKSAARLLSVYPELIISILEQFYKVDDLYVVERLYAITYGAVTNFKNNDLLKDIATWVWENLFKNAEPIPHIILRDYARGILEYANTKKLLNVEIKPESFRPPYKSSWPLDDPSEQEISQLSNDEHSSSIRSSIMGFPGDFGNYSMSGIHDWSPTSIKYDKPQTAHELQIDFSEVLKGDLKKRFVKYLEEKKEDESRPRNFKSIIIDISETPDCEKKPTVYDLLKQEIDGVLTPEQKEHFRWVMGLGRTDSIASFSRKKAHRWVYKRAIELGWTKELFEDFERYHTSNHSRSESIIERIGKKYQWIAFYEFLAHIADNCIYIDKGYSDADYSEYFGPWQLHIRNIDPTSLLRKTGDSGWDKWEKKYWWQPFVYQFTGTLLDELKDWLWDENITPPFESLLSVSDQKSANWLVLKSFANWKKDPKANKEVIPYQDAWYRINSCIIKKDQYQNLKKFLKGKNLCDPHILKPNSTGHEGYLKEYPWHPIYEEMDMWCDDLGFNLKYTIKNLVPTVEYEWESGSTDCSLEQSISIYLPSIELINKFGLHHDHSNVGEWKNNIERTVFYDPSIKNIGPSAALVDKDTLFKWLEMNDLQLVWFVGGEKQLFTHWASKFYGRLVYSGIYTLEETGITGDLWFLKEEPNKEDIAD